MIRSFMGKPINSSEVGDFIDEASTFASLHGHHPMPLTLDGSLRTILTRKQHSPIKDVVLLKCKSTS